MRILSLTYEYPPIGGGGGAVAAALNAQLVLQGDTVDVVTSRMPHLPEHETIDGVEVYRAACWRRHTHFTTAPELATALLPAYARAERLIRERRPDLLHTHFVLPSGLVAWQLSRKFDIPYVLTAHGSDIPGYNPDRFEGLHVLLKPLWKTIVRNASGLTSPSEFLAGLIHRHIDTPIRVVPNGYAPPAHLGKHKRNLVLVVARLFPRKGVQHFIDSIAGMNTEWEFVVAGDGPYLETLKAHAARRRANVRFTGFLDRATLRELYEEARIFVFPSIRENFPVVLLEAMDAGCAVITTDAEGCAEVVGKAGIVVPKGDADQIRTALRELMSNAPLRNTLGAEAQARIDLFRWPRIASQFQDVFRSALRPDPRTLLTGTFRAPRF